MTIAEYHDGVNWNTLATENYVNNLFRPITQFYTNNLTTQNLTANVWTKLGGNITNSFSLGFPVDLTATNGITNRITKIESATSGAWYKADASAVVRSNTIVGNLRLSLQIVKNGVLSSVVPNSCPIGVAAVNVNSGVSINTSYIQLTTNDYVEVFILATSTTTLTLVDLTFNVMRIS